MRVQTCSRCKHTMLPQVAKHGESLPSTAPTSALRETPFEMNGCPSEHANQLQHNKEKKGECRVQ